MRLLALSLSLAALASPAAAQLSPVDPALNPFVIDNLRAQQEAAQRRAIDQANQLMSLEANQRAQQAVNELALQRLLPATLPTLPYPSGAPPVKVDVSKLPSIPDSALADSNQRVQAAAKNRR